jgi:N-methylhydantoinase A
VDSAQLGQIYDRLGRDARGWLREEGIDEQRQDLSFQADVRYFRQGYEFALQVNPESLSNGGLADLEARFGDAHERLYGFRLEQPVELVNLRAVGAGQVEKVHLPSFELEGPDASAAVVEQHRVHFDGGFVNANIYDRKLLRAGHRITGPAVITQADSTTVIHPGHVGAVDRYLNILISPEGGQPA